MTRTIEELKAIEQAATKGPWWTERDAVREAEEQSRLDEIEGCTLQVGEVWAIYSEKGLMNGKVGNFIAATGHCNECVDEIHANAAFIVEARTAMQELIEEVENLRQQKSELLECLKQLTTSPFNSDEMGGCLLCGGSYPDYATEDPATHSENCPYIKARQLIQRCEGSP